MNGNARDETDLETLTAELVSVVQETMQPESVGVWLRSRNLSERPVTDLAQGVAYEQ